MVLAIFFFSIWNYGLTWVERIEFDWRVGFAWEWNKIRSSRVEPFIPSFLTLIPYYIYRIETGGYIVDGWWDLCWIWQVQSKDMWWEYVHEIAGHLVGRNARCGDLKWRGIKMAMFIYMESSTGKRREMEHGGQSGMRNLLHYEIGKSFKANLLLNTRR